MPRNQAPATELGTTCGHGTEFRAHIQFRADDGKASQPATILNIGACQHTTVETRFSCFFLICVGFYGHFPVELYA